MSEQRGASDRHAEERRKKKRRKKRSGGSARRERVAIGELHVRPRSDGKLFAALALACVGAGMFVEPTLRLFLGFGGFALGFLSLHRQGATGGSVVGAELQPDGLVSLTMANGELIHLPASSFARVTAETRVTQTSSSEGRSIQERRHLVMVHKRDGGAFEVASFGDDAEAANDAAKRFGEALAAVPASAVASYEPVEVLRELPGVSVSTTARRARGRRGKDETLEVRWSAAWPWPSAATWMITVAAIVVASTGVPDETHLLTGLFSLFGVLSAGMLVRSFGSVAVVRLDRDALTLEKCWHGRTMSSRVIPLHEVAAVELANIGNGTSELMVRRVESSTAVEVADEIASGGPLALVRGILRMSREREQLPRGGLSLGDYMLLDLALSGEIARRKGVDPDSV